MCLNIRAPARNEDIDRMTHIELSHHGAMSNTEMCTTLANSMPLSYHRE